MINTQDLLNMILTICIVIITGFTGYVSYSLVQTLKSVKRVADDIEDTTKDIQVMKQGLKVGALSMASTLLTKLIGGEK